MRRDWPIVASGIGLVVLSATPAIAAILAYRLDNPRCDPPRPPAVMIDGCYPVRAGFDVWIGQPGVIVFLAITVVLLVLAVATIRYGLGHAPPR